MFVRSVIPDQVKPCHVNSPHLPPRANQIDSSTLSFAGNIWYPLERFYNSALANNFVSWIWIAYDWWNAFEQLAWAIVLEATHPSTHWHKPNNTHRSKAFHPPVVLLHSPEDWKESEISICKIWITSNSRYGRHNQERARIKVVHSSMTSMNMLRSLQYARRGSSSICLISM